MEQSLPLDSMLHAFCVQTGTVSPSDGTSSVYKSTEYFDIAFSAWFGILRNNLSCGELPDRGVGIVDSQFTNGLIDICYEGAKL